MKQNISGCHHCKHPRLSERRLHLGENFEHTLSRKTILRTSFTDFFPPFLSLLRPNMRYPKERKQRPLGGSHALPGNAF